MSHTFRFLGSRTAERTWTLGEDEARHAGKILRLELGTVVEVADGRGSGCTGTITELKKNSAAIRADDEWQVPAPVRKNALAVGALKPAALDELLPHLVEHGIDVIAVFSQPNVAKFRNNPQQVERWQRIVQSSFKQCKRAWLPEILNLPDIETLLQHFAGWSGYLLEPSAQHQLLDLPSVSTSQVAIVGGELGLTEGEVEAAARAGFQKVALGTNILRAITAGAATAFALAHRRQAAESRRQF